MSLKNTVCWILFFFVFALFISCSNQNYYHTAELQKISRSITNQGGVERPSVKKDTLHWLASWKDVPVKEKLVKDVGREFSFLNQNVYIDLVFPADDPDIQMQPGEKIYDKAAFAVLEDIKKGRIKWDIVTNLMFGAINDSMGGATWYEDYVVDFRNVEGFKETQQPLAYNADKFSTGPAIEGSYTALYYNKKIAEKLGIQIKQFGMTYNDLLGYIKALENYNQKNGTHIIGITDFKYGQWHTSFNLAEYLHASKTGVPIQDLNYNPATKELVYQTFADIQELVEHGGFDPEYKTRTYEKALRLPLDDKALFHVDGSWIYNQWYAIDSVKVYNMVPCELPVYQPVDFYLGGYGSVFAVFKDSPRRNIAVEFLMHWASKDVVDDWIAQTKSPSGGIGSFQAAGIGGDPFEVFARNISQRYHGKFASTGLVTLFGPSADATIGKIYMDNCERFIHGEIDVDAFFEMIDEEAKKFM